MAITPWEYWKMRWILSLTRIEYQRGPKASQS